MKRVWLLMIIAALSGCGQTSDRNRNAAFAEPQKPTPLYSQRDGDTYMYVGEQTADDKKEGKSALVVGVKYLGQEGSNYRLEELDDRGMHVAYYECPNPCRVVKQTLADGEFSMQALDAGTIVGSAFEDAFNGLLEPTSAPVQQARSRGLGHSVAGVGSATDPASVSASDVVAPNITGNWRMYRTRITEGWWTEPTFGNRYVIIRWGCGTGCTFNAVGDHRTGQLYDLGLGGEAYSMLDLRFSNASDVIKAQWLSPDTNMCIQQTFVWAESKLQPSGQSVSTPADGTFHCPNFT